MIAEGQFTYLVDQQRSARMTVQVHDKNEINSFQNITIRDGDDELRLSPGQAFELIKLLRGALNVATESSGEHPGTVVEGASMSAVVSVEREVEMGL